MDYGHFWLNMTRMKLLIVPIFATLINLIPERDQDFPVETST